jgi:BlaI family penicillinase repressor
VKQSEYLEHENNHFLNRFYDGNLTSMLTSYLGSDSITEGELEELRSLLKKPKGDKR